MIAVREAQRVEDKLRRAGIVDLVGAANVVADVAAAVERAKASAVG